jgi:hypothetical protein
LYIGDRVLSNALGKVKVGVEVVDNLSEDTSPVDRVDSSETMCGVEVYIREEGFDGVLQGRVDEGQPTDYFLI